MLGEGLGETPSCCPLRAQHRGGSGVAGSLGIRQPLMLHDVVAAHSAGSCDLAASHVHVCSSAAPGQSCLLAFQMLRCTPGVLKRWEKMRPAVDPSVGLFTYRLPASNVLSHPQPLLLQQVLCHILASWLPRSYRRDFASRSSKWAVVS